MSEFDEVERQPTRGATEFDNPGWVGRPAIALLVRGALFLAPLLIGWLAVRYTQARYWRPDGWVGTAAWVVYLNNRRVPVYTVGLLNNGNCPASVKLIYRYLSSSTRQRTA